MASPKTKEMNARLAALFTGPWPALVWQSVIVDKDGLRFPQTLNAGRNKQKGLLRAARRFARNKLILKNKELKRKGQLPIRMKEFIAQQLAR